MDDCLQPVICPTCHSVTNFSLVVAAHKGNVKAFLLLGACVKCRLSGDNRSLHYFTQAKEHVMERALDNGLPMLLVG